MAIEAGGIVRLYRNVALPSTQRQEYQNGQWINVTSTEDKTGVLVTDFQTGDLDKIAEFVATDDPGELRGFVVTLILSDESRDDDDPKTLVLPIKPVERQVIRHRDKYYLIRLVEQSTGFGIAIFAQKITYEQVQYMAFKCQHPVFKS